MKDKNESVKEWFFYAKEDLKLASLGLESGILPDLLCFHAQQAVEKAIKALLVQFDLDFPKTHNIQILLTQLSLFLEIPEQLLRAEILTDYAVTSRYPGVHEQINQEEYRIAIKISREVIDWVAENIIDPE